MTAQSAAHRLMHALKQILNSPDLCLDDLEVETLKAIDKARDCIQRIESDKDNPLGT